MAITSNVFEKCIRISRLAILLPLTMVACIGCANTGSSGTYLIGDEAPAPLGYSDAVLAKRIVPLYKSGA